MQTKLTTEQIGKLKQARNGIAGGIPWLAIDEAKDFWQHALNGLDAKIKHGTSDGKPWIDAEPPIPEGWRRAEPDEWQRRDVKYWDLYEKDWRPRLSQGTEFDPPKFNTRYIVPIDPPLTDEDACVWPRLLVMVRDCESKPWEGPLELQGVSKNGNFRYPTNDPKNGICECYRFARRATPAEIEAANDRS